MGHAGLSREGEAGFSTGVVELGLGSSGEAGGLVKIRHKFGIYNFF